jgi:AcrR family transcriptional regulator
MGIAERRERERKQRMEAILLCAWEVAEEAGWSRFSVERVAQRAELGRATVYGYFESAAQLVVAMSRNALDALAERLKAAPGLAEALDVPVRFAQANPSAFQLLFPPSGADPMQPFASDELHEVRAEARKLISHLQVLARRGAAELPEDEGRAAAFLAGISLAGAVVPELFASTTLRHRWQQFCLGEPALSDPEAEPPFKGGSGSADDSG